MGYKLSFDPGGPVYIRRDLHIRSLSMAIFDLHMSFSFWFISCEVARLFVIEVSWLGPV